MLVSNVHNSSKPFNYLLYCLPAALGRDPPVLDINLCHLNIVLWSLLILISFDIYILFFFREIVIDLRSYSTSKNIIVCDYFLVHVKRTAPKSDVKFHNRLDYLRITNMTTVLSNSCFEYTCPISEPPFVTDRDTKFKSHIEKKHPPFHDFKLIYGSGERTVTASNQFKCLICSGIIIHRASVVNRLRLM